jgi:prepilin-type N-terminal cleavage/methylation domain-containing protein
LKNRLDRKGFTLIEIIVVIALLSILSALMIPDMFNFIEKSKVATDLTDLRTLNTVTSAYRASNPANDPFKNPSTSDETLMQFLVDQGFIPRLLSPVSADADFEWDSTQEKWFLITEEETIELVYTPFEYFAYNLLSTFITGYDGRGGTDLVLPNEVNGVIITRIGQDAMHYGYNSNTWAKLTSVIIPDTIQVISGNAFHSNALTSVDIPDSVTSLGANAFYGNLLTTVDLGSGITEIKGGTFASNRITEIVIPSGIQTIGDGAFQSNAITKITIGDNTTLTRSTSLGNYGGSFKTFYDNSGKAAGTYVYENGTWTVVESTE